MHFSHLLLLLSVASADDDAPAATPSACGRTWSSPRHHNPMSSNPHNHKGEVEHALIFSLCQPSSTASLPYLRPSSANGFFGQLNSFAQQLFDRMYAGDGVPGGHLHKHIYETKTSMGQSLDSYFRPNCMPAERLALLE